jgi:hypothetical protein
MVTPRLRSRLRERRRRSRCDPEGEGTHWLQAVSSPLTRSSQCPSSLPRLGRLRGDAARGSGVRWTGEPPRALRALVDVRGGRLGGRRGPAFRRLADAPLHRSHHRGADLAHGCPGRERAAGTSCDRCHPTGRQPDADRRASLRQATTGGEADFRRARGAHAHAARAWSIEGESADGVALTVACGDRVACGSWCRDGSSVRRPSCVRALRADGGRGTCSHTDEPRDAQGARVAAARQRPSNFAGRFSTKARMPSR